MTLQYTSPRGVLYILITCLLFNFPGNQSLGQCLDNGNLWNQSWKSCEQRLSPNPSRPISHWLLYEFAEAQNIDSSYIWNANRAGESNSGVRRVTIDYSSDDSTWVSLGTFTFPKANEQSDYKGFIGPDFGGIWVKKILFTVKQTHGDPTCASLAEVQFQINEEACYGELDICGNCNGPGERTWYKDEDGDGRGTPGIVTLACTQPSGYVANADDNCDNGLVGWKEIDFIFMENGCRGCHGTNGAGGLDLTSYVSTIQGGNKCGTDILTGNTLANIIMVDGYNGCGTPIGMPSMNQRTGGMIDSTELAMIQLWIDAGTPEDCNCMAGAPDADGDGICDRIDECPNFDNNLIGSSCNDGLDCTINDLWTAPCLCEGTPQTDTDGDGICDVNDLAPNNPCTADGVIDGDEPVGWKANMLNDCDTDGISVVAGDLNDFEACVNGEGSLSTAACNCGSNLVLQGGQLINSTGVGNTARFADGVPDGNFTNGLFNSSHSLTLETAYLGKGEKVCITTRYSEPDKQMRVEVNGELFTFANQDSGRIQEVCFLTRSEGVQTLVIKEGANSGTVRIDGISFEYCPCSDASINGNPDTSATRKAYSDLTGWQNLTEPDFWVCEGDSLVLGLDSDLTTNFNWNGPTIANVQTGDLIIGKVSADQEGLYTATYTNSQGCVVRKDIQIYVEPAPQITYSKIDPACPNPNSGVISFSFQNSPNRSSLEFSINGKNGPYRTVADNMGTFSMTDLSGGTYELWTRWESNHIEIKVGEVSLMSCQGIKVAAFLEGPFDDANNTMLSTRLGSIDKKDPYVSLDSVPSIPNNVVDWVLLQIRDKNDNTRILHQRAAFIKKSGRVFSIDNTREVSFPGGIPDSGFVSIIHRNHLGVMTANAVDLSLLIDFRDPTTPVYGFNPRKMINGRAVLYGGDANADGSINAVDKNAYWRRQNGQPFLYKQSTADINMDGSVNVVDANGYWRPNNGKITQIPN